jgi:hypothetical protein
MRPLARCVRHRLVVPAAGRPDSHRGLRRDRRADRAGRRHPPADRVRGCRLARHSPRRRRRQVVVGPGHRAHARRDRPARRHLHARNARQPHAPHDCAPGHHGRAVGGRRHRALHDGLLPADLPGASPSHGGRTPRPSARTRHRAADFRPTGPLSVIPATTRPNRCLTPYAALTPRHWASRGRSGEARLPRLYGGGRPAQPGPGLGCATLPGCRGGPGPGAGLPPGAGPGILPIAPAAPDR